MLGKTLLISGGITDLDFAAQYLSEHSFDSIVCADFGLEAAYALRLPVKYIMGDFDSVSPEILKYYRHLKETSTAPEFMQYPRAKDATDTEMAIRWLVEQKPEEITILGATGGRLDHFLANIHVLMCPMTAGIPAFIIDSYNRLFLTDRSVKLQRENLFGKYISLIPLTERVYPVNLRGLKYPLEDYTLTIGNSRAVSNEIAEDADIAEISFSEGILIIIESRENINESLVNQ